MSKQHQFRYQAFFCEENIWQLANDLTTGQQAKSPASQKAEADPAAGQFVLFYINSSRQVMLMNQAAFGQDGIGMWDYHVTYFDATAKLIYDFDTQLSFPSKANDYIMNTFLEANPAMLETLAAEKVQLESAIIRVISAQDYVNCFYSDRSHMLDENGNPTQEFPDWNPICSVDSPVNLTSYWNSNIEIPGARLLSVDEFTAQFDL